MKRRRPGLRPVWQRPRDHPRYEFVTEPDLRRPGGLGLQRTFRLHVLSSVVRIQPIRRSGKVRPSPRGTCTALTAGRKSSIRSRLDTATRRSVHHCQHRRTGRRIRSCPQDSSQRVFGLADIIQLRAAALFNELFGEAMKWSAVSEDAVGEFPRTCLYVCRQDQAFVGSAAVTSRSHLIDELTGALAAPTR